MARLEDVLNFEEQDILAFALNDFYKQLQKLSAAPQGSEEVKIHVYNLVREQDEYLQLLITNAFANSKWKRIHVDLALHHWSLDVVRGDTTLLFNTVFRGLARNGFVEAFSLEMPSLGIEVDVSIPSLPPQLKELELWDLNLCEDEANNKKGIPELIQNHEHLKRLELHRCAFCPKALGVALSGKESLGHLLLGLYGVGDMKGFFDTINNSTIQALELDDFKDDSVGVPGIEAMHRALNEKRLAPQKIGLTDCLGDNEVQAVARMLEDYPKIKELNLSKNSFEDEGLKTIISSLQNCTGLQSLNVSDSRECDTSKSIEVVKDFVRSRPDGTLERVRIPRYYDMSHADEAAQEEIDTLLDINKLKPLVRENQGVPLSVLQHKRLDCTYFFIRSKPEVCSQGEEPPRKRQKTRHDQTSESWCTIS